jgi:TolB-like protein/Tfp pilus assembly protein PilF
MGGGSPERVNTPAGAVFLSYASQDAEAAQKICDALRAAGIEVWFDKSELRGGDVWDRQIREQIHNCRLFMPVISANTEARDEGYFRREWALATDRTRDMAEKRAFLIPVVVDDTTERGASVPDKFHQIQWTRLPGGVTPPAFVARVAALLGSAAPAATANRPSPALASTPPSHTLKRRALGIALGLAILAIVIGGGWFALRQSVPHRHAGAGVTGQSQPAVTEKSIAVLPFVDMSEKHDQEYFGDGIAEEILNLLVKIPNLKVIGRTSSFQFKGKNDDLRRIGMTLGAAYVVEGSVRKAADQVRVTAQLINTHDGVHLWSATYDRSVSNVIVVQDEIAASLTRALQLEVVARPHEPPHSAEGFNQAGFEEAAAYFRQSLKLDPQFAGAAEALARVLLDEASWGFVSPQIGFARTRDAATAALALDPNSALAHAVLGSIHTWHDWDWAASERELRTAVALAPNDPVVLFFSAEGRLAVGHWDDATRLYSESRSLDPLLASVYQESGWTLLRMGRLLDAESAFRRGLEISPTYVGLHHDLGTCLLLEGKLDAALSEMQREVPIGGRSAGLAVVYHAMRRNAEADREVANLEADHSHDMAFPIAEVHAYRGRTQAALEWLDRAYAQRDIFLWLIKGDPLLKSLAGNPRYTAFLRKINLPE